MTGIGMGFELKQIMALVCPVCEQYLDSEKSQENLVEAVLFGVKKYGICIACLQIVKRPYNKQYKEKWDKEAEKEKKLQYQKGFNKWLKKHVDVQTLTMDDYLLYRTCYMTGANNAIENIAKELRK